MTMLPDGLNNRVRPSGAALATAFIPTIPPAPPPLFSTTKLSFGRSLPSPFARMRAIGSSAPPGAYGITIRIVSAAAGAARKQSTTVRPDSRRMGYLLDPRSYHRAAGARATGRSARE
jgi:hypothetical protein